MSSGYAVAHDLGGDDEALEQQYHDQIADSLSDDPADEASNVLAFAALRADAERLAERRRAARVRRVHVELEHLVASHRTERASALKNDMEPRPQAI